MEILCFKIKGKFAHYRKYYANNTAFSFSIPPRTSIMGVIAAIMGLEKDSYYESLSSDNIRIGLRVLSPLKKRFHRLNLLSIKSIGDVAKNLSSDFRGEKGRIQTPFEVVSGWDISKDEVAYQVFVSYVRENKEFFEKIKFHFLNKTPVYNISLGIANFNASLFDIELIQNESITEKKSDDFVLFNSVLPSNYVKDLKFEKNEYDSYNFVEEDMMPGDFLENQNREVRKMNNLLFSITPNPIRVKFTESFYEIILSNEIINIQFMDL